jgi:hypothetical protein
MEEKEESSVERRAGDMQWEERGGGTRGKTEGKTVGADSWHSEVEAAWELASPGAGHTHLDLADHSLEQMTRQPLSPTAEAT